MPSGDKQMNDLYLWVMNTSNLSHQMNCEVANRSYLGWK